MTEFNRDTPARSAMPDTVIAESSEFTPAPDIYDPFDVHILGDLNRGWQDVVTSMIVEAMIPEDVDRINELADRLRSLWATYIRAGDRTHDETFSTLSYLLGNMERQIAMVNPIFPIDSPEALVISSLATGDQTWEQLLENSGLEPEQLRQALSNAYGDWAVNRSVVILDGPKFDYKLTPRGEVIAESLERKKQEVSRDN